MYYEKNNCLVSISNSILKHFGIDTFHETHAEMDEILEANKNKKICLCLFDGMGKYIEELHCEFDPIILKHKKFTITSVFPPTTVAATTSLMSSKFPCETGWLGWTQKLPNCENPVVMFYSRDDITQKEITPNNFEKYKYTSIIDRIRDAGFKADELKSFEMKENSLKSFFNVVDGKLKANNFLYAYNEEPDASLHEYGTKSPIISKLVKQIDDGMGKIALKNPGTLFIVLADHGHIDTKYFLITEHEDFTDCLLKNLNYLEPRSAVFLVKPDRKEEFKILFNKYYGDYFKLYSKEEVKELKIFGEGTPNQDFDLFLGDFLAVSHSEYAIVNSPEKMNLKSHHAGGTDQEKYINISIFNNN